MVSASSSGWLFCLRVVKRTIPLAWKSPLVLSKDEAVRTAASI